MKKTLFALALAGSFVLGMNGLPLYAQMGPPMQQGMGGMQRRGMDPEYQLKHLTLVLDLTSEQQAQIKPILEERVQKMQEVWRDNSLTRAQRRDKMMALREESKTKIEAVLNDKQKEKYDKLYKMQTERMQQRWQNRGMPQPQ